MSFDIKKRDQIATILHKYWLTRLDTEANRIMVADVITKELFGDPDGYLNDRAYGDNPITPTADPDYVRKDAQVVNKELFITTDSIRQTVVEEVKPQSKGTSVATKTVTKRSLKGDSKMKTNMRKQMMKMKTNTQKKNVVKKNTRMKRNTDKKRIRKG